MARVIRVGGVIIVPLVRPVLAVFRNFVDWLPFHVVGVAAGSRYVLEMFDVFPVLPLSGSVSEVGVSGLLVLVSVLGSVLKLSVVIATRPGGGRYLAVAVITKFRG